MGLITFALEIGGDVGYAAVVDVAVGMGQAPFFRVGGKILAHVFVYQLLQIDFLPPQRTDDDIGTHAFMHGHIPHRIADIAVGGIVGGGAADLLARLPHQLLCRDGMRLDGSHRKSQCEYLHPYRPTFCLHSFPLRGRPFSDGLKNIRSRRKAGSSVLFIDSTRPHLWAAQI